MENASTALLIAGGVLLAMLILSLGVMSCTSINSFKEEQAKQELNAEVAKFNDGFTAYNKSRLFGTDVISVWNKAIDNNKKYAKDDNYKVNIKIVNATYYDDNEEKVITINIMESSQKKGSLNKESEFYKYCKTNIFKCTEITYNNENGRIDTMTFEQI